jgi:hypothetical protein
MSARTTIHFICDEQNLIHAGPLHLEAPVRMILGLFNVMISYRLPRMAYQMRNPRCWIIRVNREPVKSDYVLQEGDEVLIGGQHVEHLPWKLHIREPNYTRYWLRRQYRRSKQRAHCTDYMIVQQQAAVSHYSSDFCVDFITRGNLSFPQIPAQLLLPPRIPYDILFPQIIAHSSIEEPGEQA